MKSETIKEIYNKKVKEKYHNNYEHGRWFNNPIARSGYEMTLYSIKHHLFKKNNSVKDYLELGPGAGTWTKLFIEQNPQTNFDLVDISGEMLGLAKKNLSRYKNVNINYFEKNFLEFRPQKKYNLFFSCRTFEYLPNKELAIKKIAGLLTLGGKGFIVTKTPKYLRNKILGRKIIELHQGQISPRRLRKLLKKIGLKNLKIFPVTMNFALLRSAKINKLLHKMFFRHKLSPISQFFSESYCIEFTKE